MRVKSSGANIIATGTKHTFNSYASYKGVATGACPQRLDALRLNFRLKFDKSTHVINLYS